MTNQKQVFRIPTARFAQASLSQHVIKGGIVKAATVKESEALIKLSQVSDLGIKLAAASETLLRGYDGIIKIADAQLMTPETKLQEIKKLCGFVLHTYQLNEPANLPPRV